jgi:anti-sigma B factor antagonist
MDIHQVYQDPLAREELVVKYLKRRLDAATTEAFESHYLSCDECFERLRVAQLLVEGLNQTRIDRRYSGGVAVLQFTGPVHLTHRSAGLTSLAQSVLEQKDTHVLIDLSRVVRVDSAGLGTLMSCYSHAIRNRKAFKILNPPRQVRELLHLTKIHTVLETYDNEQEALESFGHS